LKGSSHDALKFLDAAGWLIQTLMIPPIEKPTTQMYSMMTMIHCAFVVQRMP
jgi:hypothetical protein